MSLWSPAAPRPYLGTFGVFLGAGLSTLSARLVDISLPDLRGALGLGVDEAAWIGSASGLAVMFMGPWSVYLGALLGVRRVLLAAGALFTLTSALTPLAPGLGPLLALQVVAGLASGTFYPLSVSFALRSLPPERSTAAVGVFSIEIVSILGLATPLAAFYVEHLSWRWVFWQSAVLTPVLMGAVLVAIPDQPAPASAAPPAPGAGWFGFLCLSLGLTAIYAALSQGERLDWLGSGLIVGLLAAGGLLLAAGLVPHLRAPGTLAALAVLVDRHSVVLGLSLFGLRVILLAVAFLIPAYLGAVQGYRPEQTGRALRWLALPQLATGLAAAWLVRRSDARWGLAGGLSLAALACVRASRLTCDWAGEDFRPVLLLLSLGLSFAFVSLIALIARQAADLGAMSRPVDALTLAGFFQVVRLFGGQVGGSLMQHALGVRQHLHWVTLGAHADGGDAVAQERLALLRDAVPAGLDAAPERAALALTAQVSRQSLALAHADMFLGIVWVCALLLVALTLLRPSPPTAAAPVAASPPGPPARPATPPA